MLCIVSGLGTSFPTWIVPFSIEEACFRGASAKKALGHLFPELVQQSTADAAARHHGEHAHAWRAHHGPSDHCPARAFDAAAGLRKGGGRPSPTPYTLHYMKLDTYIHGRNNGRATGQGPGTGAGRTDKVKDLGPSLVVNAVYMLLEQC